MKYAYYPGCSMECNAAAYELSTQAVAKALGFELVELEDWNCCGATEYFSQDELTASAVVARNLALVDPQMNQLVAPCAACYRNLAKVDNLMGENAELNSKINMALDAGGLKYEAGSVQIRHLLDVIYKDFGEEGVKNKMQQSLEGLRIAPYYGCQVVRPIRGADSTEYPMQMDELFSWLGAEVVDYPVKAHCCGGHMTQISEDQAFEMIRRLLQSAVDYKADMILCMCPMCQLNLDAYQSRVSSYANTNFKMPIIYFTQMLGIAFGLNPKELGFGKELVPALPTIEAKLK
ncbi:MAG: CoB--CoM heterodisulfide reductase iron-sulfur subunit B family protein [Planctomycetota bacterium]|nr:CoB--CoM heterodisulfide reductase iron-sulfur subunit B family protein [Planctomycetota bacterium]